MCIITRSLKGSNNQSSIPNKSFVVFDLVILQKVTILALEILFGVTPLPVGNLFHAQHVPTTDNDQPSTINAFQPLYQHRIMIPGALDDGELRGVVREGEGREFGHFADLLIGDKARF